MDASLASDPGHLNPDGGAVVADAFLAAIAEDRGARRPVKLTLSSA